MKSNNCFLFSELIKRDFKKKYKGTVLGVLWSLLSPLLLLLVMKVVFTEFFGRDTPHYTTYLFCGTLVFSFFRDATNDGMSALRNNIGIFSKIKINAKLFVYAANIQVLINFCLTIVVFFIFCIFDNIVFGFDFLLLVYPITTLFFVNVGISLILSSMYVFFRDIKYLWTVFSRLLTYLSAIFYTVERFPLKYQRLFLLNPVYVHIRYFREIVINHTVPGLGYHLLMFGVACLFMFSGLLVYSKSNTRFPYYA